eukprot:6206887-Pleurochrysis_carterae.AAC.1
MSLVCPRCPVCLAVAYSVHHIMRDTPPLPSCARWWRQLSRRCGGPGGAPASPCSAAARRGPARAKWKAVRSQQAVL